MEHNDKVYIVQPIKSIVLDSFTGVQIFLGKIKGFTDKEIAVYVKDSNGEDVVMVVNKHEVFTNMSEALTKVGERLEQLTN